MTEGIWRVRYLEHPSIAVVVGTGFPWLLTAALRVLFPGLGLGGLLPLLYLAVAITQTVVATSLNVRNIRGLLPRLREAILVLLVTWVVLKIAAGEIRPGQWRVVSVPVFLGAVLTMAAWLLTLLTHAALGYREDLLTHLAADTAAARGDAYRDLGTEATASLTGLRRVRALVTSLQVLGLLLVFTVAIARPPGLPVGLVLVTLGHVLSGLAVFLTVTGYIERQTLRGGGYVLDPAVGARKRLFLGAGLLVTLLVVLTVTGARPPLPARYLQDALAWLQRVLTPRERPAEPVQVPVAPQTRVAPEAPTGPGMDFDPGPGNPTLERIIRIVLIVLVAGVPAAALAVALVAPLFRRRSSTPHPLRALRAWWKRARGEIARGLAEMTGRRETGSRRERATAARGPGTPRRTVLEEINRGRELRLFARVVRWGRQQGVPYRPSQGPREYTSLLARKVPGVRGELDSLSEILEEQLYSGGGVGRGRALEYVSSARRILRYRP